MPYVLDLPQALAARGLTVEVVPGWQTRGSAAFNPYGSVSHWTAGPKTGDRPSLKVVVEGRPGLSGPLANVFLTRAGVAVVVAAGRANHAGAGGIGGLLGNSSVFGTEAENSGGGEWTDAQRWAYPRINAAYIDLGAKPQHVYDHQEWAPDRKIDIRDWPMPTMRQQVAALLEEDDMPLTEQDLDKIAYRVWSLPLPANDPAAQAAHSWLRQAALPAVIEGASAQEIAAALPDDLARQVADELARRLQEA